MKRLASILFLLFLCLGVRAANPSFTDFNSNQFNANPFGPIGSRVQLANTVNASNVTFIISNVFVTNLTVENITNNTFFNGKTVLTTNLFVSNAFVTNLTVNLISNTTLFSSNAFISNLYVTNLTVQYISNIFQTNVNFNVTNVTINNAIVTNLYVSNVFATNITVNNLNVSNAFITNEFVSNAFITNLFSSNAFLTNLFVSNAFITNLNVSNAFITNLFSSNAFITNLFVSNAFVTNLTVQNTFLSNAFITNEFVSNAFITNLFASNSFITNLFVSNAFITNLNVSNAFITNLFSSNAFITNLFVSNAFVTNLTVNNSFVSNAFITNLNVSNAFITNEFVSNSFITNLFSSNAFITNLFVSNAFITNLNVSNAFITNLFSSNSYITNLFVSNAFITNLTVQNFTSVTTNQFVTNLYVSNLFSTNLTVNNITNQTLVTSNIFVTNVFVSSNLYTPHIIAADATFTNSAQAGRVMLFDTVSNLVWDLWATNGGSISLYDSTGTNLLFKVDTNKLIYPYPVLLDNLTVTNAITNTLLNTAGFVTNDATGRLRTTANIPNAALANSSVTIAGTANQVAVSGGGPLALGGTATLSTPNPFVAPGPVSGTQLTNTSFAAIGVVTNDAGGKLYTTPTLPASLHGPMVRTIDIPMGAWFTNNCGNGADVTVASMVTLTNSGDTPVFTVNATSTNEIRTRFSLPRDWDASTVQIHTFWACTGTNSAAQSKTNIVVRYDAAAVGAGDRLDNLTFGSAVFWTNNVNPFPYEQGTEGITSALTVGNTPAAGKGIVWRIQLCGNAAGTTETNSSLYLAHFTVEYRMQPANTFAAPQ